MRVALVLLVGLLVMGVGGWARQEPNITPLVRGAASFVIPGLGQYLNGEYDKALTHFVVDVGLILGTSCLAYLLPYPVFPVVGTAHTLWALYSAMDAYQTALELEGLSLNLQPGGFAVNF
ncbi:MAG: hypothetical protein NUV94_00375 [Candidatus Acetothermia bacterium]|jgi:hypothetical protein|nr:hypothetical protein [Candidatus Acetothermia bacterium]